MDHNSLTGVIFDMDGVLLDSEPFIAEAGCRMLKERYGVKASHADFMPFVGMGEDRFLGGVAEKYEIKLNLPADKTYTYDTYLQLIRGHLGPLPGAVQFIKACRKRGLKLAVATSADKIKMDGNLNEIGLPATMFDALITGNDVIRKKPDPEIFILAAEAMGVDPKKCLIAEDAVMGIRAGKAAGARCLGVTTSFPAEDLKHAGADWLAPDLAHVPPEALAW